MNIRVIILLISSFLCIEAFAANQVFHYEPEPVALYGVVKITVFETASIFEVYPSLTLNHPIDVKSKYGDKKMSTPEKNVQKLHVTVTRDSNWGGEFVGVPVCISGVMYHKYNEFHRTPVLIYANHFEKIKESNGGDCKPWIAPKVFSRPKFCYQPRAVTLTGVIKREIFPGSPEYSNIKDGDEIEEGAYLHLDNSIDVLVPNDGKNFDNRTERNVKIIQIAGGDDDNWSDKLIGRRVHVTGYLFSQNSSHQHASVLIDAKHFEALPFDSVLLGHWRDFFLKIMKRL